MTLHPGSRLLRPGRARPGGQLRSWRRTHLMREGPVLKAYRHIPWLAGAEAQSAQVFVSARNGAGRGVRLSRGHNTVEGNNINGNSTGTFPAN
jgi:hypothetical protein